MCHGETSARSWVFHQFRLVVRKRIWEFYLLLLDKYISLVLMRSLWQSILRVINGLRLYDRVLVRWEVSQLHFRRKIVLEGWVEARLSVRSVSGPTEGGLYRLLVGLEPRWFRVVSRLLMVRVDVCSRHRLYVRVLWCLKIRCLFLRLELKWFSIGHCGVCLSCLCRRV